ncbi:MAG: N-acetyl-gamma-glutamyl-phosphate reductase [Bacteroidetes bacterium]|nr:MAG: N-acetyl-gamma-glutamyl-phosphate reductase [Bacteroidota bacterium]
MKQSSIGILGGAGYTAGELIRILLYHPDVHLSWVHSESHARQPLTQVHSDLLGETELHFTAEPGPADVVFLCAGHGKSKALLERFSFAPETRIIDLGNDFRIASPEHDFLYGLPELNREAIRQAKHIANPGCFATAIQLALLPLAQAQLLENEVHIQAITGSTGAGQNPEPTTHFSWRSNNLSVYKPFSHQHLPEIRQSLHQLQSGGGQKLNFVPIRGDFTRGIFASIYLDCPLEEQEAIRLYEDFYREHPFTHISAGNPNLKQVVNTNKCILHLEKHGDKLLIISLIDNLLKGASGQAIQNMNLMLGLEETAGLWLKGVAF